MANSRNVVVLGVLLSVLAIALSVIALVNANSAKNLALSEITVEEQNSLATPVFDQSSQSWSFIALYELNVTNQSGPNVVIEQLVKLSDGSGFIVPLKGQNIIDKKIEHNTPWIEISTADFGTFAIPRLIDRYINEFGL